VFVILREKTSSSNGEERNSPAPTLQHLKAAAALAPTDTANSKTFP